MFKTDINMKKGLIIVSVVVPFLVGLTCIGTYFAFGVDEVSSTEGLSEGLSERLGEGLYHTSCYLCQTTQAKKILFGVFEVFQSLKRFKSFIQDLL